MPPYIMILYMTKRILSYIKLFVIELSADVQSNCAVNSHLRCTMTMAVPAIQYNVFGQGFVVLRSRTVLCFDTFHFVRLFRPG